MCHVHRASLSARAGLLKRLGASRRCSKAVCGAMLGRCVGRPLCGRPVAQWVAEASDPRLALYRQKGRRDEQEVERQARQVLQGLQLEAPRSWRRWPCQVKVHYSWQCLRRLLDARRVGRQVELVSLLLSSDVEEEQKSLAEASCEQVYVADARKKADVSLISEDPELIAAEFAYEGTSQRRLSPKKILEALGLNEAP